MTVLNIAHVQHNVPNLILFTCSRADVQSKSNITVTNLSTPDHTTADYTIIILQYPIKNYMTV